MPFAFVFPGQGSQSVGMLSSLAGEDEVRATFAEASAVLRIHLIEHLPHEHCVLMVPGENYAFAGYLARGVTQPVFHQIAQDRAIGVLVVNDFVDFL